MTRKTIDDISDYTSGVLLTVWIFAEMFTWDPIRFTTQNYHYWIIAMLGTLHLVSCSQRILNKNLFRPYYIFSVVCFLTGLLKKYLAGDNFPDLILTTTPLVCILLLHASVKLLYPSFPNEKKKFVIISYSKYGVNWDGKSSGYKPDKKEVLLSAISFFGPLIYFFLLVIFVCKRPG
jgi:hypothetical protein